MNNVSKASLRLFDKLKPLTHERHYIICESPNVQVGGIRSVHKTDIYKYVGLSAGYTRKLLRELCDAGYIAFFYVGDVIKVAVNPDVYRVNLDVEPSRFIVDTFRMHKRVAEVQRGE